MTEASKLLPKFKGFSTDAIHAGQKPDPTTGAVVTPISLAATYQQHAPGKPRAGYEYGRGTNPTREALEANIAKLEGAKHGVAFGSGLAATSAIAHLLKAGDHVICISNVYGGTFRYFENLTFGMTFSYVDLEDSSLLEKTIKPETKLIWLESLTNPMLRLCDMKLLCDIAHKHKILVAVDNTFLSPYFCRPMTFGADLILHSMTKYINGHSDVIMGMVLCNDEEIYKRLRYIQNGIGAIPSPFDSFLVLRGVKTLAVRMKQHEINAQKSRRVFRKLPENRQSVLSRFKKPSAA